MQVTIVGLPGSGKTTVFNALTGSHAETGGFSGSHAAPNMGVVKVPDERLHQPPAPFPPAQNPPAALLHVARGFEGGDRPPDAWRDVEEMDLEFTVAVLGVIEKRLEKLRTSGRHGSPGEREQNALEEELLARVEPDLSRGIPLRALSLTDDDERRLRGYRFLTQK